MLADNWQPNPPTGIKNVKILDALKKGHSVVNPAAFKKAQNLINLVATLAPILILTIPALAPYMTPEVFAALGMALAGINAYITTASTDKIGV